MQTCSTCQHWRPYDADNPYKAYKGRGWCAVVTQDEKDAAPSRIMANEDAEFVTDPTFGCNRHEAASAK